MSKGQLASRRLAGFVVSDSSGSSSLSFKAHDPIWDREIRAPVKVGGENTVRLLRQAGATPAIATFDQEGHVHELEVPATQA